MLCRDLKMLSSQLNICSAGLKMLVSGVLIFFKLCTICTHVHPSALPCMHTFPLRQVVRMATAGGIGQK